MIVKKNSKPLSKTAKYVILLSYLIVTLHYDVKHHQTIYKKTQTVCGLCGYIFKDTIAPNRINHFKKEHTEWIRAYWLRNDIKQVKNEHVSKKKSRVYLKPWKDPDSLFCDTDFLKEYLGREPAKGTECKEGS